MCSWVHSYECSRLQTYEHRTELILWFQTCKTLTRLLKFAPTKFQPSVAFHIETSHLICNADQITECNAGLKWFKGIVKRAEPFKFDVRVVSKILSHKRINSSLKE